MNAIPDFTEAEQKLVSASHSSVTGSWFLSNWLTANLQLDAGSDELTLYPTIYCGQSEARNSWFAKWMSIATVANSSIQRRNNTAPAMTSTAVWVTAS
jgi:hypothetical protein